LPAPTPAIEDEAEDEDQDEAKDAHAEQPRKKLRKLKTQKKVDSVIEMLDGMPRKVLLRVLDALKEKVESA
jgi:hypothetical protein